MNNVKFFTFVRQYRWPDCLLRAACDSSSVIWDECNDTQPQRQRYRCKACASRFSDFTGTILAGHRQLLRMWVIWLYFMGLNPSNRQIAYELGLDGSDVQAATEHLRRGLDAKAPKVELTGEGENDEVHMVAEHKGQSAAVAKRSGSGTGASWQARRAEACWRRTSCPSLG